MTGFAHQKNHFGHNRENGNQNLVRSLEQFSRLLGFRGAKHNALLSSILVLKHFEKQIQEASWWSDSTFILDEAAGECALV